jgi:hypothetical protein
VGRTRLALIASCMQRRHGRRERRSRSRAQRTEGASRGGSCRSRLRRLPMRGRAPGWGRISIEPCAARCGKGADISAPPSQLMPKGTSFSTRSAFSATTVAKTSGCGTRSRETTRHGKTGWRRKKAIRQGLNAHESPLRARPDEKRARPLAESRFFGNFVARVSAPCLLQRAVTHSPTTRGDS